ncbi:unnamed protein product [Amoebophrya sp. A25]|nr:unnamed protein product [Amoebophrya sp. A25]|eukprot:GSA25T00027953001.1
MRQTLLQMTRSCSVENVMFASNLDEDVHACNRTRQIFSSPLF